MSGLDKRLAGPSLNGLAAGSIERLLVQLDMGADPHDYSLSGTWTRDLDGLTLVRSNVISVEAPQIYSRVTWEFTHSAWSLVFTERRRLIGRRFAKSAPYQVALKGDLLEAARFLSIPKELFLQALRADGWSGGSMILEQLRWLPGPNDPTDFKFVMQSL